MGADVLNFRSDHLVHVTRAVCALPSLITICPVSKYDITRCRHIYRGRNESHALSSETAHQRHQEHLALKLNGQQLQPIVREADQTPEILPL